MDFLGSMIYIFIPKSPVFLNKYFVTSLEISFAIYSIKTDSRSKGEKFNVLLVMIL